MKRNFIRWRMRQWHYIKEQHKRGKRTMGGKEQEDYNGSWNSRLWLELNTDISKQFSGKMMPYRKSFIQGSFSTSSLYFVWPYDLDIDLIPFTFPRAVYFLVVYFYGIICMFVFHCGLDVSTVQIVNLKHHLCIDLSIHSYSELHHIWSLRREAMWDAKIT